MQLQRARLCLDCEELHEGNHCPRCASEAFAFLTQWLPADDRGGIDTPVRASQRAEASTSPWALGAAALATLSPFN